LEVYSAILPRIHHIGFLRRSGEVLAESCDEVVDVILKQILLAAEAFFG
jgi:hypothetical protein